MTQDNVPQKVRPEAELKNCTIAVISINGQGLGLRVQKDANSAAQAEGSTTRLACC